MRPIRFSRRLLASLAARWRPPRSPARRRPRRTPRTTRASRSASSSASPPAAATTWWRGSSARKLSEIVGQPVIIENRPGAAGQLAVTYAQSQPADGYTMIVGAIGQLAIATAIYPEAAVPSRPGRSCRSPCSARTGWPSPAPMQHGINSVKDLVAFAKANPDKSNYPTSSPAFTIPAEMLKLKTGMPGQTIPYKSTNEMMLSVARGRPCSDLPILPIVIPLAQGGKVRLLAMTGPSRLPELPDVPTTAEAGFGISTSGCSGSAHSPSPARRRRSCESSRRQSARLSLIQPCATSSRPWRTRRTEGAARSSGS